MSEGKQIFTSAGISSSLDTVLATTLNNNYRLNYKRSNNNLLSEKSLSNNSSKSSSGSSLTLTNNNNNSANSNNVPSAQFPHHQFYSSQISTSANWNSNINIRSNSLCSQKVRRTHVRTTASCVSSPQIRFIYFNCLRKLRNILALLRRGFKSLVSATVSQVHTDERCVASMSVHR